MKINPMSNNVILGLGHPWKYQYGFNNKVNTFSYRWSKEGNIPTGNHGPCVVVTKNRVYLIGGYSTENLSDIYTTPISDQGVLGQWSAAGNLPIKLYGSSSVVVKNKVHLLGGWDGKKDISDILTSTINDDGTLGEWRVTGNIFSPCHGSSSIVTKNKVYLLGGIYPIWPKTISDIYVCDINDNGTLGAWSKAGDLPFGLSHTSPVVINNNIHLLGGWIKRNSITDILTCEVLKDGSIGQWKVTGSLPVPLDSSTVVQTNDKIFLAGGWSESPTFSGVVTSTFIADIDKNSIIKNWRKGPELPKKTSSSTVITTSSKLYLLGGLYDNSSILSIPFSGGLNDYSEFYK